MVLTSRCHRAFMLRTNDKHCGSAGQNGAVRAGHFSIDMIDVTPTTYMHGDGPLCPLLRMLL
jgi:hypothetical protein